MGICVYEYIRIAVGEAHASWASVYMNISVGICVYEYIRIAVGEAHASWASVYMNISVLL